MEYGCSNDWATIMLVLPYFEFFSHNVSSIWFTDQKSLEVNNLSVSFNNSNFNVAYLESM